MLQKTKLLMLIMLAGLLVMSACTGSNSNQKNADEGSTNEAVTDDKSPITVTMFSASQNTQWDDMQSPVGQKIKK